jgi:hypothetical protein
LTNASKRWGYAVWLALIAGFAVLHALNLRADFPNHTMWIADWAKYTDEGWYGDAAVRAHLFGNWYMAGDFNPAVAVPVWPFLEWVLFFFTGVTVAAARGLAVAMFFLNLLLSYTLLRTRGPRWMGLLAVTLMVTSPFLYCFGRLAILEPLLTLLTLAAMNLAVRLPGMRRPVWGAAGVGALFTLMMLTKTNALFLLPAVGWAMVMPLSKSRKLAVRCASAAAGTFVAGYGFWMAMLADRGLIGDFRYYFDINHYAKPSEFYWPVVSFWWSFHGGLWIDRILFPVAGVLALGAAIAWMRTWMRTWGVADRRSRAGWGAWGRGLLGKSASGAPVFGASVLAVGGMVLFMTYQDHPQPRYFAVAAVFCFMIVAQGAEALTIRVREDGSRSGFGLRGWGGIAIGLAVVTACVNGAQTVDYAAHPQYTFVNAADGLTHYIDTHPNGKRLLVSSSGDEITLVTQLPTLCDDFGTMDLSEKLDVYRPGWYADWNHLDSLEQVAAFPAFDDPERNLLVLYKLHPLPGGKVRDLGDENLQIKLPDDSFDVEVK